MAVSMGKIPTWFVAFIAYIAYAALVGVAIVIAIAAGWALVAEILHFTLWAGAVVPAVLFFNRNEEREGQKHTSVESKEAMQAELKRSAESKEWKERMGITEDNVETRSKSHR